FIGKNYERSFDEFEVILALTAADSGSQTDWLFWGPIGRFGWKHSNFQNSPFKTIVEEAKDKGQGWPPLASGLFGGRIERFSAVAEKFQSEILAKLHWW